jgi:hypothetical protein
MDNKSIIDLLENKHQELFDWIKNQPDENWEKGPENKWTSGQQIQHLTNSLQLLNNALSYPKFFIRYKYGTSNRPSRSFNQVAKRYEERLSENQERARIYNHNLKKPLLSEKEHLLAKLQIQNKKLQYKTHKLKDKELDSLLVPHPLMGRMTLREIIMWTAHHTAYHTTRMKINY